MKKLIAILLACMLTLALCACGGNAGSQNTTDNQPVDSNVDQTSDAANAGTPITTPNNAAVGNTTSSLAVSENVQAQEAAAAKLSEYQVDIDLEGMNKNLITAQMQAINQDPSSYIGKTIRVTGTYQQSYYEETDQYYNYVLGYDETSCCAAWGMEFYGDSVPEKIEPYTSISMVGTISTYDENGIAYTFVDVEHFAMA